MKEKRERTVEDFFFFLLSDRRRSMSIHPSLPLPSSLAGLFMLYNVVLCECVCVYFLADGPFFFLSISFFSKTEVLYTGPLPFVASVPDKNGIYRGTTAVLLHLLSLLS